MRFSDSDFAEFLNSPRIKREWDNLSNGAKHRQTDEEDLRVTAQVLMVDANGNVGPQEYFHD